MKAIDTNVLVRFLVNDDAEQANIVRTLFRSSEENEEVLFVPVLVMMEVIWVLQSAYKIPREDILRAFQSLLMMPMLSFDKLEALQGFIQSARSGTEDLSDLLIAHAAIDSGCSKVLTFDKKASAFKFFQKL